MGSEMCIRDRHIDILELASGAPAVLEGKECIERLTAGHLPWFAGRTGPGLIAADLQGVGALGCRVNTAGKDPVGAGGQLELKARVDALAAIVIEAELLTIITAVEVEEGVEVR